MSNEIIIINGIEIITKEYESERVVTAWDIAKVHQREVKRINEQFNRNRKKMIEGKDFFSIKRNNIPKSLKATLENLWVFAPAMREIILFTESGYLMLNKVFEDDLSWNIQRQLVNTYFKAKEMANELKAVNTRILPSNYEEALEELLIEVKKTKALESKIEEDRPKVEFYDTLIELKNVLDMKKSAKILNFYNLGRNRLYEILRWNKVLMKDNEPYQFYFERGWFTIKESIINDKLVVTTYVTNKGLEGIRKLLLKLGYKQRDN